MHSFSFLDFRCSLPNVILSSTTPWRRSGCCALTTRPSSPCAGGVGRAQRGVKRDRTKLHLSLLCRITGKPLPW
ncbi:hypothetical protein OYC64_018790 [Pagothenia borchgrevinki]|uniref:Uncharacterized protein n=2 Tax=Notothenioidei TaxID=8205 RepID=A0AAN8GW57_9TELE|nr:hypothetical protein CesoFtcFv8_013734 [Champsocephalus esox]